MTSSAKAHMNRFSVEFTAAAALSIVAVPSCLNWHLGTGADKRQQPEYAAALVGEAMSL
jgi:hypothetical protein